MITAINNILVFKTNIQTAFDKIRIQDALDSIDAIEKWNVDLQDTDCVLRIVSDTLTPGQIISVINHRGFECSELE
jgi:accessory colonization factor AcfC